MKKSLFQSIYIYYAIFIVLIGLITKFFLVDTDIGARMKNYDHRLLASDIAFICALILGLIGFSFKLIKNNDKSTLKDSTIKISFFLIAPLTFIFAITPILETVKPGKVGDSLLGSIFEFIVIIGTIGAFAWVIMILIIILKQLFTILTQKN